MSPIETPRLRLQPMGLQHAPFMLRLLNEPSWLQFVGDRGVRSLTDAERYIREGPMASVERHGFGFGVAECRRSGQALGMCGLTQRDYLDAPDIGFAFLPEHCGQGLAHEAAAATLQHGLQVLKLPRILATTRDENLASQKLLTKLGLRFERHFPHPDGSRQLRLYAIAGPAD
ncbi:GNAT family N-acetyltransferase [Inhella proteolytica]|uniref:GNAT family N-acetyltransferase n=1 Tax=Inhella proteolytica TaxID=2795029 RepID=A0A931NHK4_9BURK|nr:GNAT family N-acetyltransferase [Inhella proteolytica]MBH9578326.1 GNAT family N-acetyltransferase [Inhella proteolytica]